MLKSFLLLTLSVMTLELRSSHGSGAASTPCDTGQSSFSKTLYPALVKQCAQCHDPEKASVIKAPPHTFSSELKTYERILSYLDNVDFLEQSTLAKIGGNSHCNLYGSSAGLGCSMLSTEMNSLVQEWWTLGQIACPLPARIQSNEHILPKTLPDRNEGFQEIIFEFNPPLFGPKKATLTLDVQVFERDSTTEKNPLAFRAKAPRLKIEDDSKSYQVRGIKLILNKRIPTGRFGFFDLEG